MKHEEVQPKYTWAIDEMIADLSLEEGMKLAKEDLEKLETFCGNLKQEEEILNALNLKTKIARNLEHLYTYCTMKLHENTTDAKAQTNLQLIMQSYTNFLEKTAFIEPQLLELGEQKMLELAQNPRFSDYDMMLRELIRQQAHILTEKEEAILAGMSEVLGSSSDIYDMLCDADLKFGEIEKDGEALELTISNYSKFMEHENREVRRNAFKRLHSVFGSYGNAISAMYSTNIKSEVMQARFRKYPSSLEMSLFSDNIPSSVYHNLVKVVKEHSHLLQRYVELKKKSLQLNEFHIYDLYLPFVCDLEKKIGFDEAFDIIVDALQPLGEEYISILKNAKKDRWMDAYSCEGKPGGAYSSGSYDSKPFILLNHNDKYSDMSTMAHELGHSMHSYLARENQPFTKADYSLFVAEVASTVNEVILIKHLLSKTEDKKERQFLIGNFLDQFKGTLFRQVMFADFEAQAHASFEEGNPMGMENYNELHYKLNKEFFGDSLILDEEIKYEWMRIPHFYRSFYVFVYSTSYCAATAIASKIFEGDKETLDGYLKMLKSGGSMFPIDELKLAGIDMSKEEPIRLALAFFEKLLDEYEASL